MSKIEALHDAGEEDDYDYGTGKSSVYLGLVDGPIKEDEEPSAEDTFIGGEPCWLEPDSVPDETLLRCDSCKSTKYMKLLAQAFAPVELDLIEPVCEKRNIKLSTTDYIDPNYTRVLYVFYCTRCKRKNGSIKCIRGVKKNTTIESLTDKMSQLQGKNFDVNPFDMNRDAQKANPFDSNPFNSKSDSADKSAQSANPFSTAGANPFAKQSTEQAGPKDRVDTSEEVIAVNPKTLRKLNEQKKDKDFDSSKAFKGFFLYVEEESFKHKPDLLKLPKNLKIDKDALELPEDAFNSLEENTVQLDPRTEKLSKFLDDDVFQKFQEVVAYNPGQVLRYDLGGTPLYYAKTPKEFESLISKPAYNPASTRVFEMQLMPNLIQQVEEEVSLADGMDWGTVFVYTDIENYIPKFDKNQVGYVQEVVKVQWEPIDYEDTQN